MKKALLALTVLAMISGRAAAVDMFWDLDNGNIGATTGTTANGTWDTTTSNWNLNSNGSGANTTWVTTNVAVFSADADATGISTVTPSGTQVAAGITVQEGTIVIGPTGAVNAGAGPIVVNSGAVLETNSSLRITTTAGSIYTLNGGTLRTTNPSAAGSFVDVDSDIVLNGGGTFEHTTANILNIVQTTTSITGTGPLTKTGAGVLAIASTAGTNTYSGGTIINDGELRMRTVVNTLPVTTAVTVNSPGIFNLNNVSTQIGSLTGNGQVGLSGATLTVDGAASTTFTGAIKNVANAGAGGLTTGNGRLTKAGAGVLTLSGINDYKGRTTLTAGGIIVSPGAVLSDAIADLYVDGGTLTLNNVAQTVENLNNTVVGVSTGTVVLGTGHTLTTDPAASTTFAATITGPGALTKANVLSGATNRTLTLTGTNTYDGVTTISGGKIQANNASALGSTVGNTQVASGAELLFDGVANNFTIAEPIQIAGGGAGDGGAITVQNAANITFSGAITVSADATITTSSTATAAYTNANAITGTNTNLTIQGGAGAGGGSTVSGAISLGTGSLTKAQGGTWRLNNATGNSYSGGTNVNAGTLLVNNTSGSGTGSGAVTVASTGTLGGSGSIAGTVTSSGTLSPGNSPGVLTIGGDLVLLAGNYKYEIDSTPVATADLTNVTGNLSITSGAVTLAASDLGSSVLAMGTKFTLINYGGTWNSGTFIGLPNYDTNLVIGSNRFQIIYNDTSGGSNFGGGSVGGGSKFVTITAVPEASALLTMGLGFIFTMAAVWVGKRFGVNALKV